MSQTSAKDKARAYNLKRLYGITEEQYDELLERQTGKCPVCLKDADEFDTRLAVDHDHTTGEIRGLLCRYCNHRVVGRHRDPSLLRRVADYLEIGTGWFVPPRPKKKRKRRVKSKNPGSEGSGS